MMRYQGNWPSNVSKDAKYSVVSGEGEEMKIRLIFQLDASERALLSTTAHPDLVDIVNAIKEEHGLGPKGPFYINEYGHVIVPAGNPRVCYFGGRYEELLEFDLDGRGISAVPDESLSPGDEWTGPHVGIRYTLAAGGNDLYYKVESGLNRERQLKLSEFVGDGPAAELARRLGRVKESGRVYINEARHFFMPVDSRNELRYIYAGPLSNDQWFPEPDVPAGW